MHELEADINELERLEVELAADMALERQILARSQRVLVEEVIKVKEGTNLEDIAADMERIKEEEKIVR